MLRKPSPLHRWIQENNELVNKCKDKGENASRDQNQTDLRCCTSELHKLLRKLQGIPLLADHAQLELTVVFNTGLRLIAQSGFSEAEGLLTHAILRVLQVTGDEYDASDPLVFWKTALKSAGRTTWKSCVLQLLCLQWAIWLATCQLKIVQEFRDELFSLAETLSTESGDDRRSKAGKNSDTPLLLMDPRQLSELLQISTLIAQGAERLSEGQSSEALSGLQTASSLPSSRTLTAYTHLLSGSCLAQMSRPQMALQCYRKALETDPRCVCALYQSMLIYRQLGNTQAEIQALRLLHTTLMLPCTTDPLLSGSDILPPPLLLSSQSLRRLLMVPSALSVLHSLALKCVLHGRVSEGVEYYLDLLAALQSENHHAVPAEVKPFPRLPELYLEAAAALLMDRRPADSMGLCDEVISSTLELLPEKVVLEEMEKCEAETRECTGDEGEGGVETLLWAGAAYLLQGHCYTHLKDWKQAVTHYTRCINLLVRICFKNTGFQPQIPSADMVSRQGTNVCILQRLKGLSLAGRGISFIQTHQLKEALRDLQLSLQALPDCQSAGLWCGEVLWRLGRKPEAAACWEQTWSLTTQSSERCLSVYLLEPQTGPSLNSTELRCRLKGFSPTMSS